MFDKDLRDIRRRAGLVESGEFESEAERRQAQIDTLHERVWEISQKLEQKIRTDFITLRIGVSSVDVTIERNKTVEIRVTLDSSEITMQELASLSEHGVIQLGSKIEAMGTRLDIVTVLPWQRAGIPADLVIP